MKISIIVEQKQTLYESQVVVIDTDDYVELENKTLEELRSRRLNNLSSGGEVLDFLNMENKGGESMRDEYELYDYKLLEGNDNSYVDDQDMGDIIVIDVSSW